MRENATVITDRDGDTLEVYRLPPTLGKVGVMACHRDGDTAVPVHLTPKQARKVRKALKRYLAEVAE